MTVKEKNKLIKNVFIRHANKFLKRAIMKITVTLIAVTVIMIILNVFVAAQFPPTEVPGGPKVLTFGTSVIWSILLCGLVGFDIKSDYEKEMAESRWEARMLRDALRGNKK